eukprot:5190693-Prymnesium_polylepis.1
MVTPLGRWSGFESGRVLTPFCAGKVREPRVQGEEKGLGQSIHLGDGLLHNGSRLLGKCLT